MTRAFNLSPTPILTNRVTTDASEATDKTIQKLYEVIMLWKAVS